MAEPQKSQPQKTAEDKPPFIWITNNRDGAVILAHRPVRNEASKTTSIPKTHTLMPGASLVPTSFWEQWKREDPEEAHRMLRSKIPSDAARARRHERSGMPHLVEGPFVADRKDPLFGLSQEDAIELVGEILDQTMLEHLLKVDRRQPVAVAITATLERMKRGAVPLV